MEQAGLQAAERLLDAFLRAVALLRDFPRSGTFTHRIEGDEWRQFPVAGFVVHFRVSALGNVVVADVRHGRMRQPTLDVLEQRAEDPTGDEG